MRRARLLAFVVVCVAWLQAVPGQALFGQAGPDDGAARAADLAARRARIMAELGPDTVLVLWSAPPRTYSADIEYPYRQDSNLLYLTGLAERDVTLVLVPGAAGAREFLFVPRGDARQALWFGHRLTPQEATAASGIATVIAADGTTQFEQFMEALLGGAGGRPATADAEDVAAVSAAGRDGRLALAIVAPAGADGAVDADATPHVRWANEMRARHPSLEVVDASDVFRKQRRIKTPYEQRVLAEGAALSAAAHVDVMRATHPGLWEYQIKAFVEHAFLNRGARSWGYPPIVGSGPNATTLHYLDAGRRLQAGDLLLIDAAGNFQDLTADITRTFPVDGRFTPAARRLYELVLRAEEAGIAAARPGVEPSAVTQAIRAVFGDGLRALGLVQADAAGAVLDAQVDLWFPHEPIHGIGVDVHDPLGALDVGTAFVIEPGLYIRPDAFDRLPASAEADVLRRDLASAVAAYRDLGVRIEDSFLMTSSGPVMLSAGAPRRVADIERLVGTRPVSP